MGARRPVTSDKSIEGLSSEHKARREFLKKTGRFAAITPPAIVLLLGTSLNSQAIAASNGTRRRRGWYRGGGPLGHRRGRG